MKRSDGNLIIGLLFLILAMSTDSRALEIVIGTLAIIELITAIALDRRGE